MTNVLSRLVVLKDKTNVEEIDFVCVYLRDFESKFRSDRFDDEKSRDKIIDAINSLILEELFDRYLEDVSDKSLLLVTWEKSNFTLTVSFNLDNRTWKKLFGRLIEEVRNKELKELEKKVTKAIEKKWFDKNDKDGIFHPRPKKSFGKGRFEVF
jgi:hypothetical protein